MAFTVKIVLTPCKGLDPTKVTAHQTAVKSYLDGVTVNNFYSATTTIDHGYWITTIIYD